MSPLESIIVLTNLILTFCAHFCFCYFFVLNATLLNERLIFALTEFISFVKKQVSSKNKNKKTPLQTTMSANQLRSQTQRANNRSLVSGNSNKSKRDAPSDATSTTAANLSKSNNKVIQQDHDDEAEDQLLARNPREWPFPSFEPYGEEALKRQKQQLQTARKIFNELRSAPAVVAIQAPLEPDRPAWKSVVTVQHHDVPPLDLRAAKYSNPHEQHAHSGVSPNAYLLGKTRHRWVSIAETKLVSGCPSRGLPLREVENPSAVAARRWEKGSARTRRGTSIGSTTARSETGASQKSSSRKHENNNKQQQQQQQQDNEMSRSIKKLLANQDSQAAGTRNHLHREEKVLSFLRESTKAQADIVRMVTQPELINDSNLNNADAFLSKSSRNCRQKTLEKAERKRRLQEQQEKDKSNATRNLGVDNEPVFTFEDLVQPKDATMSSSARLLPDINEHKMSYSRRKSVAELAAEADSLLNQSKRMMSSLNHAGTGNVLQQSARVFVDSANQSETQSPTSGRKILVRLPKVGLQLFSAQ